MLGVGRYRGINHTYQPTREDRFTELFQYRKFLDLALMRVAGTSLLRFWDNIASPYASFSVYNKPHFIING